MTSHGEPGSTGRTTGVYLEELAVPCGYPVDRFLGEAPAMAALRATPAIDGVTPDDFDAIFLLEALACLLEQRLRELGADLAAAMEGGPG